MDQDDDDDVKEFLDQEIFKGSKNMTDRKNFRVNLHTARVQRLCARNRPTHTFLHRSLDQSDGAGDHSVDTGDDPDGDGDSLSMRIGCRHWRRATLRHQL